MKILLAAVLALSANAAFADDVRDSLGPVGPDGVIRKCQGTVARTQKRGMTRS